MAPDSGPDPTTARAGRPPSRQRGAAMIEFAIVASLLLSLLLAIVDFGQLFWTNLTMQHAVREGARYAVTGQSGLAPLPTSPTARCDAALAKIREQAMGLYERTSARAVFKTVAPDGTIRTLGAGTCYGAGQIIIVQVDAAARVWTPILASLFSGGEYRFSVATTMKNEAFR